MTSPLEKIDVDCGCLVETCDKQGCAVGLRGSPSPFLLIDMDHPDSPAGRNARPRRGRQRGVRRCDYLFIGEGDEGTRLYSATQRSRTPAPISEAPAPASTHHWAGDGAVPRENGARQVP